MKMDMNIVNMIYLVVVLSCSLKFILIVNFDKRKGGFNVYRYSLSYY